MELASGENGVWNPDAITSVTYGLDAESYQYEALLTFITPLDDGDFTLTARDTIFDAAGGALDGDVNGAAGGDWTTTFTIFPTRQVNTTTNDSQESPSVVLGADGRYVVVWESYEQDGSSWGIYAQRYNPDGTAAGDEFQVNTHTDDEQRNPSVAMAADGRFVVTWQSHAQDGSSWGIYAQRYNADGTTAGDEFRVNATTEDQQRSPEVAMAANGDFVVTWASLDTAGSESNWGVYGQRYNWDAAVGGQIQIFEEYGEGASWQRHENHRSEENYPSIATTSNGAFVVVWQDTDGGGNWPRIRAKRFDASGTDLGWFDVEPTHNAAHEPTVAMVDDGRFVVTWRGGDEIYARTFNADGSAATSTVQVNQTTEGSQSAPSVLMYPDGQFLVAWQGAGSEDSEGIFARRYHADSTPQTAEFRVNSLTTGGQYSPALAIGPNDRLHLVAWRGSGSGDDNGIFTRRYENKAASTLDAIADVTILEDASNQTVDLTFTTADASANEPDEPESNLLLNQAIKQLTYQTAAAPVEQDLSTSAVDDHRSAEKDITVSILDQVFEEVGNDL